MNMIKTCILLLINILALFLAVQTSSSFDVKHLLDSKKGDKVEGLHDQVRDSFKTGSYYTFEDTIWPIFELSWAVGPRIERNHVIPIASAIGSWENNSRFTFQNINDYGQADIRINLAGVNHPSCGGHFRSNPRAVACSQPPTDGQLYLKDDINWGYQGKSNEMDIETVVLHEMGHILGLGHSRVRDAVMFESGGLGVLKRELHADDITGMYELYKYS